MSALTESGKIAQRETGDEFGARDSGSLASTKLRSQSWGTSEEPFGIDPQFRAPYLSLVTINAVGIISWWRSIPEIPFPKNWPDMDNLCIVPHHHLPLGNWISDPWSIFLCLGSSQLAVNQWRRKIIYYIASNSDYLVKKTLGIKESIYFFQYVTVGSSKSHVFSFFLQRSTGLMEEIMLLWEGFLIWGLIPPAICTLPGDLCHIWPPCGFQGQWGKTKPLWIDDEPLLCILGRLFKFMSCSDTPILRENGSDSGWGDTGLEHNGRAQAESSKRWELSQVYLRLETGVTIRGPSI